MIFTMTIPVRVNANARGHSRALAKRTKNLRAAALLLFRSRWLALRLERPAQSLALNGGFRITLTRIAPRELDSHDNLPTAMKPLVDGIADALELKNDRDPRVKWEYAQRRAGVREFAVEVEVALRTNCPTCGAAR